MLKSKIVYAKRIKYNSIDGSGWDDGHDEIVSFDGYLTRTLCLWSVLFDFFGSWVLDFHIVFFAAGKIWMLYVVHTHTCPYKQSGDMHRLFWSKSIQMHTVALSYMTFGARVKVYVWTFYTLQLFICHFFEYLKTNLIMWIFSRSIVDMIHILGNKNHASMCTYVSFVTFSYRFLFAAIFILERIKLFHQNSPPQVCFQSFTLSLSNWS